MIEIFPGWEKKNEITWIVAELYVVDHLGI